ncbi:hypothetical protein AAVH_11781 [Aphelenchoides avenae]|nr:hypothetical protein AAVH_11781 [Aphelenchus avenae]
MGLCCSLCNEEQGSAAEEPQRSTVEETQVSAAEQAQLTADEKAQTSVVDETQESAVVRSSSVRSIDGELRFERSLPRHNFIRDLIEDFRQSSSPECMRRVTFHPDKILREYVSASCHLPGAYVDFFPCPHCTSKNEEGRPSLVEVFHFANLRTPNLCATVKFAMPADSVEMAEPTGCRVEADFTEGCPNAPITIDDRTRDALYICDDVFIEALLFLPRSELEKTMLVSRRWSNVIERAARTLQQRHGFFVRLRFYGESSGMLSVHFLHKVHSALGDQWSFLRVLTTRGLSQALNVVRSHLRNAFVKNVLPVFRGRVSAIDPPPEMIVDIPLQARIDWLESLLRSMPPNSEIGSLFVSDANIGFDNFLTVASCALEQLRKLACVQKLQLGLLNRDVTWTRLASVLNQSNTRSFIEIAVATTRAAIDTSALRAILSSWQTQKLHIYVRSGIELQDGLLKLPAQIIRDFLALRDANDFVAEFSLHLTKPDNMVEVPDVDVATDRRKRFRCHMEGTVARVTIYENRAARERLTVMTFDKFRGNIHFRKGNVSLADLKSTVQRLLDVE